MSDAVVEEWKPVAGFEGIYEVSNAGQVYSVPRMDSMGRKQGDKLLFSRPDKDGYRMITFNVNSKVKNMKVHRLVAQAFIPNPENKRVVNHKDGDKSNNNVSNLEWSTHSENMQHAHDTGLFCSTRGESRHNSKLTAEKVRQARAMREQGMMIKTIAQQFGVSNQHMRLVLMGKKWKHV